MAKYKLVVEEICQKVNILEVKKFQSIGMIYIRGIAKLMNYALIEMEEMLIKFAV